MYHRIPLDADYAGCSGSEKRFSLPVSKFQEQIAYLLEAGYEFVSFREVVNTLEKQYRPSDKAVLLTFDDGCQSVYDNAFPILKEYDLPAAVFVTTDPNSNIFKLCTEKESRMTADQLCVLEQNNIAIGSHGVSHRPLTYLSQDDLRIELADSKKTLEQMLSRTVDALAVPGNWIDKTVLKIARQVGYRTICTSRPGAVGPRTDIYRIPRVNIEGTLTMEQFRHRISPAGILKKRVSASIKRFPALLLGPERWIPIRKKMVSLIK
jgi:peptidoglycan/xylan/chitin deacetylase (PgdA/CDA1 family)